MRNTLTVADAAAPGAKQGRRVIRALRGARNLSEVGLVDLLNHCLNGGPHLPNEMRPTPDDSTLG